MGGAELNFQKEDQENIFFNKNQQNSMKRLEDVRDKFGDRGPKLGGTRFFSELSLQVISYINRKKSLYKTMKI